MFPIFWLSFPIAFTIYLVPMLMYVKYRNKHVTVDERVLTKAHIRFLMSRGNLGVSKEKKAPWQDGPNVDFGALGAADEQADQANLLKARQHPAGYVAAKKLFVAALAKRAERVMLDYTQNEVGVKYYIDGVWHDLPPSDRETGDPMLAVFKQMANLNPEDRRGKQEGKLKANYANKKHVLKLASQGTKTGERVILQITGGEKAFKSLAELGMREKMEQQTLKVLGAKNGLFVFTTMPGGGLTTLVTVGMNATDRLMRDWRAEKVARIDRATLDATAREIGILGEMNGYGGSTPLHRVLQEGKPEPYIENVDIDFYDPAKGESPAKILPSQLRKEPDALLVRDLVDKETLDIVLTTVVDRGRIVVTTVRAKDAIEAVLRIMQLKPDPKQYAKALTGVLNMRLCRRLCDSCKEAYQPPPETLRKLGLPPDRVTELYRQRQPPPPESPEARKYEPCKRCAEIGYVERIGIFEFLEVSDKFREALIKKPQLDVLRKIARSEGYRTLQEEGIVLAAKGITSVAEVSRVLKA